MRACRRCSTLGGCAACEPDCCMMMQAYWNSNGSDADVFEDQGADETDVLSTVSNDLLRPAAQRCPGERSGALLCLPPAA